LSYKIPFFLRVLIAFAESLRRIVIPVTGSLIFLQKRFTKNFLFVRRTEWETLFQTDVLFPVSWQTRDIYT
jgi:hypothetical protein